MPPGGYHSIFTLMNDLLSKYNIPAPRYTSYPTVPYWDNTPPAAETWQRSALHRFRQSPAISLYIHLPYCENLCTYCGCNKRITKNHAVEMPYLQSVLAEWELYLKLFDRSPVIRSLHLGGGTPTFFQPENLDFLMRKLLRGARLSEECELSFEAHPHNTTFEHLETLAKWGFRRISIGVQDFSDQILRLINRKQTAEEVERVTLNARALGYESINYDIIYGLPQQTPDDIRRNTTKIRQLKPDRIAFYSYAHVPWIKPSQRAYSEEDLPTGEAKRKLYELGRQLLEEDGYLEIGLDHFALPSDELFSAQRAGTLHRNFMGYTPYHTALSIGLGASAISDSQDAYVQNEKRIEPYRELVARGELPIFRGHVLTREDQVLGEHIRNIMCRQETSWAEERLQSEGWYDGLNRLEEFLRDDLIALSPFHLRVKPRGHPFLRNICMAFDARYWARQPNGKLFSQVI